MARFVGARRRMLGMIGAGLGASLLPLRARAQGGGFRELPKALWVWLKSPDELDGLSRFALEWRFSALMIHFRKPLRAQMAIGASPVPRMLRELKAQGCLCYALAGEPQWAERDAVPRTVEELLALQRRYAVFEGIHLDVEPHSLPRWREPGGVAELMGGVAALLHRTRDAMPANMALQLALNPKYALQPLADGEDFLSRIAPDVQEVALMAYRDTPERQLDAARASIDRLQRVKLPWRMGVLSNPPKEPGVSYHGMAPAAFEAHMRTLWQSLATESLCSGLIFENYHSLRALLH